MQVDQKVWWLEFDEGNWWVRSGTYHGEQFGCALVQEVGRRHPVRHHPSEVYETPQALHEAAVKLTAEIIADARREAHMLMEEVRAITLPGPASPTVA